MRIQHHIPYIFYFAKVVTDYGKGVNQNHMQKIRGPIPDYIPVNFDAIPTSHTINSAKKPCRYKTRQKKVNVERVIYSNAKGDLRIRKITIMDDKTRQVKYIKF
jgi:hypothetical protein